MLSNNMDFFAQGWPINYSSLYGLPIYPPNYQINSLLNQVLFKSIPLQYQSIQPVLKPEPIVSAIPQPSIHEVEIPKKKDVQSMEKSSTKIWDEECDQALLEIGFKYNHDWKKVSRRIYNLKGILRSPSFHKNRFKLLKKQSATEDSNFKKFSHQEDLKLAAAVNQLGKNWTVISSYFSNRSPISLKNRYYYCSSRSDIYKNCLQELELNDQKDLQANV